jgi:RND family efflux transporter MFP subunit
MPFRSLFVLSALALAPFHGHAGALVEGVVLPFRQVDVSAPVSSRVVDMKVKEGDAVKEGQPLAQLYGKLEELEMQRAKALLERREFEAKGAKRLYDNKIIPEAKALESRIELDLARLQFEIAAEQVRLRTVLAPMDGLVVTRTRDVGEAIAAAQPLFRILDLSRVLVQVAVEPRAASALPLGRKVRVSLPQMSETRTVEGEVMLVDPFADTDGKVRVRLVVDNPDRRIRSGIRAVVELPGSK